MINKKKKILVFCMSYYPRFVGGAEVALKEITKRMSEVDFEFHIVTLRYDTSLLKKEKIENVFVHRIGFTQMHPSFTDLRRIPLRLNKILYQFLAPVYAFFLHRKYKFDAVWSVMAHSAGIPGNIFSHYTRTPLLLSLQEGDPIEHIERQMRIFGPLFTSVFRRAKNIQAIAPFLGSWALSHGAHDSNVHVIPNGVDLNLFKKRESFVFGDQLRIITTSRLVYKNGVDSIIRALTYMPEYIHLDIVGDGYELGVLQGLTESLGLTHRVVFHGQKTQEDMYIILKDAFIFCRPSRSEGLGNSFLEAIATGVPVIGTHVGGIPDFLVDAREDSERGNGFFCEKDNPKSIADLCMYAAENKSLYSTIGRTSNTNSTEKYTWDDIANRLQNLF